MDRGRCHAELLTVFSEIVLKQFRDLLKDVTLQAEEEMFSLAEGSRDLFFRTHVCDVLGELRSETLAIQLAFCDELRRKYEAFLRQDATAARERPFHACAPVQWCDCADLSEIPAVQACQRKWQPYLDELGPRILALRFGPAAAGLSMPMPIAPLDAITAFFHAIDFVRLPVHAQIKRSLAELIARRLDEKAAGLYGDFAGALLTDETAAAPIAGNDASLPKTSPVADAVVSPPEGMQSDPVGQRETETALDGSNRPVHPSPPGNDAPGPGSLDRTRVIRYAGAALSLGVLAFLVVTFGMSGDAPVASSSAGRTEAVVHARKAEARDSSLSLNSAAPVAPTPKSAVDESPAPLPSPPERAADMGMSDVRAMMTSAAAEITQPVPADPPATSPPMPMATPPAAVDQRAGSRPPENKNAVLGKVKIRSYDWSRNRADGTLRLQVGLANGSSVRIRKIHIGCAGYSDNLSRITSIGKTLEHAMAPKTAATLDDINLGRVNRKVTRIICGVDDVETAPGE